MTIRQKCEQLVKSDRCCCHATRRNVSLETADKIVKEIYGQDYSAVECDFFENALEAKKEIKESQKQEAGKEKPITDECDICDINIKLLDVQKKLKECNQVLESICLKHNLT